MQDPLVECRLPENDAGRRRWRPRALALLLAVAATGATAVQRESGAAYFIRSLQNPADRREARSALLDTPMLPGSVMKMVTLVAALESQTIESDTARLCRRVVTADGRKYTCTHPDLKRPLNAVEALAHSCNDFFLALAQRLPRSAVNDARTRLGLPPLSGSTSFAAALVGLDGPRMTPRTMLDVMLRLVGADRERPFAMKEETRQTLLAGLRGAATYGTANALGEQKLSALAKTGTAPMPGGSTVGFLVAAVPAQKPDRGIVVVAPGAAGLDAAAIAADLLKARPAPVPPGAPNNTRLPAPPPAPASSGGKETVPVSADRDMTVRVGMTNGGGRVRVELMPLESYVARVLAGEGQPRAADGAQEALAIAIRTFAMANRNRHRREGYDMCDTTHCQVLRAATPTTERAARATAGRVLMYQGQPASVFYSAWCGGRTELASQVWPGAVDYPFGPAQKDDACEDEPEWSSEIPAPTIEHALRSAGLRGDRLRGLRVVDRNRSHRVSRLRIDGFTPREISGHEFRTAIGRVAGWQLVKSTAFEVKRTSNGYRFEGSGFGHGVGMCVVGAGRRAADGDTAEEILRFYYPGARIEPFTGAAVTSVARAPTPSPAPAPVPSRSSDILLALPAAEERERSHVTALVRDARDEIAAKAGVSAPASLRITVHPTVDSFGRATGQPWWVSAATEGTTIELLPITLLRQRSQLERTLRHEIAHALLDFVLKGRPLWVREGAAFYFADPSSSSDRPPAVPCPSDDEFLRPLSAGAHRDAYARAEACFRREIADGKNWREIR